VFASPYVWVYRFRRTSGTPRPIGSYVHRYGRWQMYSCVAKCRAECLIGRISCNVYVTHISNIDPLKFILSHAPHFSVWLVRHHHLRCQFNELNGVKEIHYSNSWEKYVPRTGGNPESIQDLGTVYYILFSCIPYGILKFYFQTPSLSSPKPNGFKHVSTVLSI